MESKNCDPKHLNFKCIINFSQVFLNALSRTNPTKLNGRPIALDAGYALCHKDIFTIGDRHFRWEYSSGEVIYSEFPLALLYPIP